MPDRTIRHRVFDSPCSACVQIAAEMAQLIRERTALGRPAILGFNAGATLLPLYKELVYLYREESLPFRNVIAFNMEEYQGLEAGHTGSFRSFMQSNFFDHIDIPPHNIRFLRGELCETKIDAHCEEFERDIESVGGIDLQILGINRNGHLGFNKAGTPIHSRTARIPLDDPTRTDLVTDFGDLDVVPTHALSMGCGTILDARRIILMAWGAKGASALRRSIMGPVTTRATASYLKTHPAARVFLDSAAASALGAELKPETQFPGNGHKKARHPKTDGPLGNY